MPPITFRRKIYQDGAHHYRIAIPLVLVEFLGIDKKGGMVDIAVDSENGRLIITKAVE